MWLLEMLTETVGWVGIDAWRFEDRGEAADVLRVCQQQYPGHTYRLRFHPQYPKHC